MTAWSRSPRTERPARRDGRWIVHGLTEKAPLRACDRSEAIDIVWLLMDLAVFDRLTTARNWPPYCFGLFSPTLCSGSSRSRSQRGRLRRISAPN